MPLMIDTLQIHIPFYERFCQPKKDSKTVKELALSLNHLDCNLDIHARHTNSVHFEYYHPYDSIPTSHTGIGYKIMHSANNCLPHVILNASIAKILQGHNVYGNTDMITGAFEILGTFKEFHQSLCKYLDFANAYISVFDVTLPAKAPNRMVATQVRDYLRNVDWGRLRNLSVSNQRQEHNTLYFGSQGSKVGGFKVYCKGVELDRHLADLQRQAQKGDIKAAHDLQVYTDDVKSFADGSVRIEASIKTRMMTEQGLSNNLWQFLKHQLDNPDIYKTLFKLKTDDFLQALDGMRMPYDDDDKVYELLIKRLCEPTKSGKLSTTKAKNAYNFFKLLKSDGYYKVKERTEKRSFNIKVKQLCDAGFNRAYLQNLRPNMKDTPVIRLLNLDLDAPLPKSYVAPVTKYYDQFTPYLLNVA